MRALNASKSVLMPLMLLASAAALAQSYPSRPVRVIVPFPAGGNTDIVARPVAGKLADALGQPFLVDNRGGANTILGAEIAAKATPDGHTLLVAAQNTLAINPYAYKKLPYDVKRDFAPVALLTDYNYLLVARTGFPARTIPELVAYAKANPGRVNHASVGEGSSGHVAQVLFESMAGVKMIHVPYKGNAPMVADLLGGNVDLALMGLASIQSLARAGKVRLIAAAADKRMSELPDLPTVQEAGYKGFTSGTWQGMVTQARVPRAIIVRLNAEINKALASQEIRAATEAQKITLGSGTPEDFGRRITYEAGRWEKVIRSVNLVLE